MKKFTYKRATATLEYAALIVLLMVSILMAQRYILRGFAGRWKSVGDTFGYGRQYDPRTTIECMWSDELKMWYDAQCFEDEQADRKDFNECYAACTINNEEGKRCPQNAGKTVDCGNEPCCKFYGCNPDCFECCRLECERRCALTDMCNCYNDYCCDENRGENACSETLCG